MHKIIRFCKAPGLQTFLGVEYRRQGVNVFVLRLWSDICPVRSLSIQWWVEGHRREI